MTILRIINSERDIPPHNPHDQRVQPRRWARTERLVDAFGHRVSPSYMGKRYRVVEERDFSLSLKTRAVRGALGVVAVICSLGFALLYSPVKDLFTKKREKILFVIRALDIAEGAELAYAHSERELQQGISISNLTVEKVRQCFEHLLQGETEDGVTLYPSQVQHFVFSLDSTPNLIFKVSVEPDGTMEKRYQKMINACTVIRTLNLKSLVLPNAKLLTLRVDGQDYHCIAERKLDIVPDGPAQELAFRTRAEELDLAIREFATFICKTNVSDVNWRNNPPLVNEDKLAVFDTEETLGAKIGLFGHARRRGLVGCVTEAQGESIKAIALKNGVDVSNFAEAHRLRHIEIIDQQELECYYEERKIITGSEPLELPPIASLEFPGRSSEEIAHLQKLIQQLVEVINQQIAEADEEVSISNKRHIRIDVTAGLFRNLDEERIGMPTLPSSPRARTNSYLSTTYFGRALSKLMELNMIHKVYSCTNRVCSFQV